MTILTKAASGAGEDEQLIELEEDGVPTDWSPDGEAVLFEHMTRESRNELGILSLANGAAKDLIAAPGHEMTGRFSPDGRWIAYAADQDDPQIFVTSASGSGRWQVSTRGGVLPSWSRDGREIVYLEPPNRIMAVDVESGDAIRLGPPKLLFEAPVDERFSLHPDGKRILVSLRTEDQKSPPLTLVVNWPQRLQK